MTAPVDPARPGSGPARGTKARAARLVGGDNAGAAKPPRSKAAPAPAKGSSATDVADTSVETVPAGVVAEPVADGTRLLGPDELAALEEQRDFLLGSLRDLDAEHDAGDVDETDYEALKDDYTARAAAVIRAIEGHHALVAARRVRVSWPRRIAVVAAVLVVGILAGVFVAHSAGQRNAGDTITGGVRQSTRDQLLQARQKLGTQDYDGAIKIYDAVLKDDPANVEALSYRGWMYRLKALDATTSADAVPLLTQAVSSLHDALAAKPDDGTSLVFLAVIYGDLGQSQKALDTLAQVPAGSVPDFMTDTVDTFRKQMETAVAAGPSTTSTTAAAAS